MDKCNVRELFKDKNIKYTRQREMLFLILSSAVQPMTAEQLFFQLKQEDSSVSLSTIYRILEVFIDKALVNKSSMSDDNKAMFELERDEHKHHLICTSCRKITAIEGCPLEEYERSLEFSTGFKITGHHLEVIGLCSKCKIKQGDRYPV